MMRPSFEWAGALALAIVLAGCMKPPVEPQAGDPNGDPTTVVVEDPGTTPAEGESPSEDGGEEPPGRTEIVVGDATCQSDSDCVKASCCHATACVARADAPDCSQTMCTANCQAGTMDCNGGCLCQDGKCAAKLWWAPGE